MAIRLPRVLVAFAIALGVAACSPFGNSAFQCQDDSQCGAGQCKAGYCAFQDGTCASGLRYGALSGAMANQCYAGDGVDAGMSGSDAGSNVNPGPDAAMTDAGSNAGSDACYGTNLVHVCFAPTSLPPATRTLSQAINTDDPTMCDMVDGAAPGCVIAAQTLTVAAGATVRATGSKPLVLVGTSTLEVDGTLDVSSKSNPASDGAGANAAACNAGTAPTGNGGGAGGSFGGPGGDGGTSDAAGSTGGKAGTVATAADLMQLRGGCRGQAGISGATKGTGGSGGGAVYLLATTSITVTGIVNASGAGSIVGTPPNAGGGGAGAGGMIGLDAPTISVSGSVFANGGGGSSGTGSSTPGASGTDPTNATTPAPGGTGTTTHGGPGGAGATTVAAVKGTNGNTQGGGGGGGGGAGVILKFGTISGAGAISPAPR